MKLRQLIAYRNALQRYAVSDIQTDANMGLHRIMHEIDMARIDLSASQDLELAVDSINSAFGDFRRCFETLKQQLAQEIVVEEATAYSQAQEWYQGEIRQRSVEALLKRHTRVSAATQDTMLNRIRYHSDWRYPGMIIRPGNRDLIDHLVNYDPLYLVDIDSELLAPALERFNDQYQRRLGCYVIDEQDPEIFGALPTGQFGFCVAIDYFNFKPVPVIRRYLEELFEKLRPGGTVAFSINDGDHVPALLLMESGFGCYTPGSAVIDAADDIGFELTYQYHSDGEPVTWLELRRPGDLHSLRGGQTLTKIIPKQL
jgi:SAM-dependent methyltransferase